MTIPPCPWPDEPERLNAVSPSFAIKEGGKLTRSLVEHAAERGYLDDPGVQVCVRCTYQRAGEQQHIRDAWHFDVAERGWLYVDGESPTQVRFATWNSVHEVPLRTLFPYHGLEHRCPKQERDGWRYFFRILHVKPLSLSDSEPLSLST